MVLQGQFLRTVRHAAGALVIAVLLSAGGCESEPGTIEFTNGTEDHLLWVSTTADRLESLMLERPQWASMAPGQTRTSQVSGAGEPDWCEAPAIMHFVLRPLDGLPFGSEERPFQFTLDDFEIVAERGPGVCWGQRHSKWQFDG